MRLHIHFFLNSAGQYLSFAKAADPDYLTLVFWIRFNVLMFPGAALATHLGALPVMIPRPASASSV